MCVVHVFVFGVDEMICWCSLSKLKSTWFIASFLEICVSGYLTTTNIDIRGKCLTKKAFWMS